MSVPRLEIHLNQEAALCIAKVEREDAESRLIVDVPLGELEATGAEGAAYRIGGTVLNILRLWHKEAFENLAVPAVGDAMQDDDFDLALRLINRALEAKTAIHSASIEFLLRQAATCSEDAHKYLENAWPLLRDRLGNS